MSYDDMITVIAAAKEGKQIQYRPNYGNLEWQDFDKDTSWAFDVREYRVKPVTTTPAREWWIETRPGYADRLFQSLEELKRFQGFSHKGCACTKIIHVREVID